MGQVKEKADGKGTLLTKSIIDRVLPQKLRRTGRAAAVVGWQGVLTLPGACCCLTGSVWTLGGLLSKDVNRF